MGLSSCEGLWRSIFTYANFLLPDSLQQTNMQTTHPEHTCRGDPAVPLPQGPGCCSSLLPLQAARPPPLQEGGRIRGGLEEEVSKKENDTQKKSHSFNTESSLKKHHHRALYSCPFKRGATAGSLPL